LIEFADWQPGFDLRERRLGIVHSVRNPRGCGNHVGGLAARLSEAMLALDSLIAAVEHRAQRGEVRAAVK